VGYCHVVGGVAPVGNVNACGVKGENFVAGFFVLLGMEVASMGGSGLVQGLMQALEQIAFAQPKRDRGRNWLGQSPHCQMSKPICSNACIDLVNCIGKLVMWRL
jgi:hypothetical protein